MPTWLLILLGRAAAGERFRKGTRRDYQLYISFFALFPLFLLAWIFISGFIPDSTVSGFPFWLGLTILGTVYVLVWLVLAWRLPLPVWIVIAVISCAVLLWCGWKYLGVL